jgi:cation diffusion facilitator family transporter
MKPSSDPATLYTLRKQAAMLSFLVGLGMLGVKSAAFFLTNSSAIFSDALESVIHVAATGMALYSVILSSRPPDASHPYGHGKVEFFSAGIEGGLITLAAVAIIFEAVRGLLLGKTLEELDTGMFLILGASAVNLALGTFLVRRGKATGSLTLVADGKHVLTDSYTSFGVIAGLALVKLTGYQALDPLVAILVALNIMLAGYQLVRTSVGGLMDESDGDVLDTLVRLFRNHRSPEWISVHHLRVMRSGDFHHVDFHLTIPFYWSVDQGHRFQSSVCGLVRKELDGRASVLIHLDPCTPDYCRSCRVESCPERAHPFETELVWSHAAMTGEPPIYDPEEVHVRPVQNHSTPEQPS